MLKLFVLREISSRTLRVKILSEKLAFLKGIFGTLMTICVVFLEIKSWIFKVFEIRRRNC